jgi:hypothetical protein
MPFLLLLPYTQTPTLYILTLCLCRYEKGRSGQVKVDRDDFISFYDFSLGAAQDICRTFYLPSSVYPELEQSIRE